MKEKTKSCHRKEFAFFVLSFEKENPNQDQVDFSWPRNMVIVCIFLPVLTNQYLSYLNKRTLLWTTGLFFFLAFCKLRVNWALWDVIWILYPFVLQPWCWTCNTDFWLLEFMTLDLWFFGSEPPYCYLMKAILAINGISPLGDSSFSWDMAETNPDQSKLAVCPPLSWYYLTQ